MLKMIRNTQMRESFKQVQIQLGKPTTKNVPGLDVDNRRNNLLQMIDACFDLQEFFESMLNIVEFSHKLDYLTALEWHKVKFVKDFLQPAYELTTTTSESNLNTQLAKLFVVLDPAMPNHPDDLISLKDLVQSKLATDYGYGNFSDPSAKQEAMKSLTLLEKARRKRASCVTDGGAPDPTSTQDEIYVFFDVTRKADDSYADPIE
ncbi:hypothetical protein AXG93_1276s1020 [Marchantia polymorpha subsp. ruderalis]|uniref:Uncharacterized protein n=1 Tax=Marchantia polymorpha subsp. ruderalis TaxID=1480154 RepID=A0A176WF24_MARPO|nr:hypothetical protein AXG93_1276s1020 [Marchantia polymorpha subsp. ruderalis]